MSTTGPGDGIFEWPRRAQPLREIEQVLTCLICSSFFSSAVSAPCGHTFCSLCVLPALDVRAQCPSCRKPCRGTQLQPNRALEVVARNFEAMKPTLVRMFSVPAQPSPPVKDSKPVGASHSSGSPPTSPAPSGLCHPASSSGSTTGRSAGGHGRRASSTASAGTSGDAGASAVAGGSQGPAPDPKDDVMSRSGCVPCPVCSKMVPKARVNSHLDACLATPARTRSTAAASVPGVSPTCATDHPPRRPVALRMTTRVNRRVNAQATGATVGADAIPGASTRARRTNASASASASVSASSSARVSSGAGAGSTPAPAIATPVATSAALIAAGSQVQKLKPVLYHLVKTARLRKMLREYGIPTHGSRDTMIRRHRSFLHFYNSNAISFDPVPVPVLVQRVMKNESDRASAKHQQAKSAARSTTVAAPVKGAGPDRSATIVITADMVEQYKCMAKELKQKMRRERRAKDKALPKAERRRVRLARKERRQMRRRLVTALTSGHLPSTLLGSSPAPPVKPTRPASASGVPSLKRQRGQQPVPSQPTASKKARSSPTPSKLVSVTSPSDHLAHAWVCVVAPNGKPFYFNPHTKVGQFAPPASETVVDCRRMGQV